MQSFSMSSILFRKHFQYPVMLRIVRIFKELSVSFQNPQSAYPYPPRQKDPLQKTLYLTIGHHDIKASRDKAYVSVCPATSKCRPLAQCSTVYKFNSQVITKCQYCQALSLNPKSLNTPGQNQIRTKGTGANPKILQATPPQLWAVLASHKNEWSRIKLQCIRFLPYFVFNCRGTHVNWRTERPVSAALTSILFQLKLILEQGVKISIN